MAVDSNQIKTELTQVPEHFTANRFLLFVMGLKFNTEVAPIWWTLNHCVVWRSIPACCRAFHLPSYSAGLR